MKYEKFSDERIEKMLKAIPGQTESAPSEEAISRTVLKAKKLLSEKEERKLINFVEFILVQVKIMQKKWWILQGLFLFFAGKWVSVSGDTDYAHRGLSVLASLFVILIIPELWRNAAGRSIEIEEASFFSLRKVYAAKLIAFGVIDTVLLTSFCAVTAQLQNILFTDILKQFIFPVMITSIICLTAFSSRKHIGELTTIVICAIANVVWIMLVLNERVYSKITPLIWVLLFSLCIGIIIYQIHKLLYKNDKNWEVQINGLSFR